MITMENFLLIKEIPGYAPQISHLVAMMNYARFTTVEEVKDLSIEQLDFLLDPESNSIGALLLHFAAVEYAYQVATFEQRGLNEEELKEWGPALNLGQEGRDHIRGHQIDYYFAKMEQVRLQTLHYLKSVDDEWLYIEEPFWYNQHANYYFMWFHVFEDEINHRGQIRMIRKRLP